MTTLSLLSLDACEERVVQNLTEPVSLTLPSTPEMAAARENASYAPTFDEAQPVNVTCPANWTGLVVVPCPGGGDNGGPAVTVTVECEEQPQNMTVTVACPQPFLQAECVFWDEQAAAWSSEGCVAVSANASAITCECTHLSAFTTRVSTGFSRCGRTGASRGG